MVRPSFPALLWRGLLRLSLTSLLGLTAMGCGGPDARAPIPTRPIDEGRADKIIAEALQKEGLEPSGPKKLTYGGKEITVDVMVAGKRLGVVYLSPNDLTQLGDNALAKKKQAAGDPLSIFPGTVEGTGIHFVVLYCSDYVYDDNVGASHEATTITAENKLDRDVRDFVMIARREHFE
jgi:hypothetical protein